MPHSRTGSPKSSIGPSGCQRMIDPQGVSHISDSSSRDTESRCHTWPRWKWGRPNRQEASSRSPTDTKPFPLLGGKCSPNLPFAMVLTVVGQAHAYRTGEHPPPSWEPLHVLPIQEARETPASSRSHRRQDPCPRRVRADSADPAPPRREPVPQLAARDGCPLAPCRAATVPPQPAPLRPTPPVS